MRKGTAFSIAAAALVAGLALGSISLASAATTASGNGMGQQMRGIMGSAGVTLADIVAKLTGRTDEAVQADRQAGTSFADIAKAGGVSQDKVVTSVLDARKTALDAAVKSGTITQAQADTALANMKDRVADRITSTTAGCNGAGNGAGNGGGGKGAGNGACGGACATQ